MYCMYERKANKVKKSGIRPPNLLKKKKKKKKKKGQKSKNYG